MGFTVAQKLLIKSNDYTINPDSTAQRSGIPPLKIMGICHIIDVDIQHRLRKDLS
jgi:hypothetical protein